MDTEGLAHSVFSQKLEQFLRSYGGPAPVDNKKCVLESLKDPKVLRAVLQGRFRSDLFNLEHGDGEKKATDEERSELLSFLYTCKRNGCPDQSLVPFIKLIEDENLTSHYAQFFSLVMKICKIQNVED